MTLSALYSCLGVFNLILITDLQWQHGEAERDGCSQHSLRRDTASCTPPPLKTSGGRQHVVIGKPTSHAQNAGKTETWKKMTKPAAGS